MDLHCSNCDTVFADVHYLTACPICSPERIVTVVKLGTYELPRAELKKVKAHFKQIFRNAYIEFNPRYENGIWFETQLDYDNRYHRLHDIVAQKASAIIGAWLIENGQSK